MLTVYKYPLQLKEKNAPALVTLPLNAEILHIDSQGEEICVWAKVETEETNFTEHRFHVFGTGHIIPDGLKLKHIKTVKMFGDNLIFHVFAECESIN